MERFLRKTHSPCPICKARLDAQIVAVDGRVRMRKRCCEHGDFDLVVCRDAGFYQQVMNLVGPSPGTPEVSENFTDFPRLRGICLDMTQRCNLNCANCFAQANVKLKPDLTLDEIKIALDKIPGRPPVVFIQGGEPTLHPQLGEIIKELVRRGCVPKLITNGLVLKNPDEAKKLKDAGLDWVFFQFDGFSDRTYQAFRGKKLFDLKMKILDNLIACEFSILLAMMVEADYNLQEIGPVLNFAFDTPHVRQISFLPGARIGRNALTEDGSKTEPIDVIDAMDKATGGGVTRKDFLAFFKIAKTLNRLTKNPDYKPKSCFYPMVLYRNHGKITGLNRMLDPGFLFSNPGAVASTMKMIGNIGRLDKTPKDPNILWICIEQFRELATLDIDDARHCNKVFLDENGRFVQSCIYNNLYRA